MVGCGQASVELEFRRNHHFFKRRFPGFEFGELFLQIGDFFCDLAKIIRVLACAEVRGTELLRDEFLKLASQHPEIGVSPYRALSVFEFASPYALHDEFLIHPIFFLGGHIAESCALAIP